MKSVISLVVCLVLGCFVLTGCSNSGEPFEEKTYTPDTQVSEVSLHVEDREIEVSLSDDEQVHIQYFESGKEFYEISVSDDLVLTMTSAYNKVWTDYIGIASAKSYRKILLRIPDALP